MWLLTWHSRYFPPHLAIGTCTDAGVVRDETALAWFEDWTGHAFCWVCNHQKAYIFLDKFGFKVARSHLRVRMQKNIERLAKVVQGTHQFSICYFPKITLAIGL